LHVAGRCWQLLGLGLGAGHSLDRRLAATEEAMVGGVQARVEQCRLGS
jgi:hypothetical protein